MYDPLDPLGKKKEALEQATKISNEDFEFFKTDFEFDLRRLGLSLSYAGLFQHDWERKQGGLIVAKFNSNEGYPVTLILNRQYNMTFNFTNPFKKLYWTNAIWGMIVPVPTPFTLLFKEIHLGFMKGVVKAFLPFSPPTNVASINEKEAYKSPLMQTNLVAALNADKSLCDEIAGLKLECKIDLGSAGPVSLGGRKSRRKISPYEAGALYATCGQSLHTVLSFKATDYAGKCAIVPLGNETGIFLRNFGYDGRRVPWGTKSILESIMKIRKQILAYPHTEKVIGKVADANWIAMAYSLTRAPIP